MSDVKKRKKINNKNMLPHQFSIEKYENLEALPDKDLFRQLYWRLMEFNTPHKRGGSTCEYADYFLEHGGKVPFFLCDPFGELKEELPDWYHDQFKGGKEFMDRYREKNSIRQHLAPGYAISGLNRFHAMYFACAEDEYGVRKGMPLLISDEEQIRLMEEDDANHGFIMARGGDSVSLVLGGELYLSINLDISDELLIDDFKTMLPVWRDQMGIPPASVSANKSWDVIKKKILDYRAIPMLDLLRWEIENETIISNGVLTVSVFPNGETDSVVMGQTIKPFLKSIQNDDLLEKLKREIIKRTNDNEEN